MLNTFEETLEVMEMRTFKHKPFFIVGGMGGGLFVILYGTCTKYRTTISRVTVAFPRRDFVIESQIIFLVRS